jgi:hypothetical protein
MIVFSAFPFLDLALQCLVPFVKEDRHKEVVLIRVLPQSSYAIKMLKHGSLTLFFTIKSGCLLFGELRGQCQAYVAIRPLPCPDYFHPGTKKYWHEIDGLIKKTLWKINRKQSTF